MERPQEDKLHGGGGGDPLVSVSTPLNDAGGRGKYITLLVNGKYQKNKFVVRGLKSI